MADDTGHDAPGGGGRSRRRRVTRAGIVAAAVAAATLVVAPAVMGVLGVAGTLPAPVGGLERLYYGHPHNQPTKLLAVIRGDRKRIARCAVLLASGSRPATCPSPAAYRSGRNRRVLSSAQRLAAARHLRAPKRQTAATPDQIGQWSAPFSIPQLGVHAVNLPTGKVLWFAYPDSTYTKNEGTAWLWDPATGQTKEVDPPVNPATGRPFNIWCAGQTLLPDGRLVVAGGNLQYSTSPIAGSGWKGLNEVLTFNPWNETWTRQPDMRHGRWYPTLLSMPDGRVVIMSGYDEVGNNAVDPDVEVFTPSAALDGVGTVENKPSAARSTSLYPHLIWTPGGKMLMVGPDQQSAQLDTSSWTWQDLPQVPTSRIWGSAVVMPSGPSGPTKAMMLGGVNMPATISAAADTTTIDLQNPAAGWTTGPSMLHARAHLNTVILPDGSLLSVGGGIGQDATGSLYSGPVYESELLPAGANAWVPAATQAEERTYHSTALLLPDGRVISAGDDRPGQQYTDKGELYSPPYLFKGARPALNWAPATVPYGTAFQVSSVDAAGVTSAVLVKNGAVTHANDMSQRSIQLALAHTGSTLTLTSPGGVNAAPPGYYMLFLLNGQGVPSVAKYVRLDPAAPAPPPPPSNLSPDAAFTFAPATPQAGELVTFTDTSTDPDGTIAGRAWDLNGDGVFDDATGPTAGRMFATPGAYTVSEKVTDNGGAPSVATRVVVVSPVPPPTVVPVGNLTTNPSFETDPAGWGTYQSTLARVSDATAPDGGFIARVTQAAGTVFTIDDNPNTVTNSVQGRTYQATAYLRAANAQTVGKTAFIRVREQSATGDLLGEFTGTVVLTNAFQTVNAFSTTRTSGAQVDVYVGVIDAAAGDAFDADAISLLPTGGGANYNQPPNPDFTIAPAAPVVGQLVTLTDTSTDPDGTVGGRAWDLNGDGAFDDATGPTAGRTFTAAGTYVVREQVTDDKGASAVAIKTITVTASGPPSVIPAGNLTANPSFEAGTTGWGPYQATVARVAGTTLPDGAFFARLTQTAGGFFALDDAPDTVASATLGSTYQATAYLRAGSASAVGKTAVLRIREMTPAGELVSEFSGAVTLTNAFQPVSVFSTTRAAGDRVEVYAGVLAAATGDALDLDAVSLVATGGGPGYNQPPIPGFSTAPAAPVAGAPVAFTDTSTDPDGVITGRAWDLNGDGAFDDGTAATVQKTFAAAGSYIVREQVADDKGATSVVVKAITVTAASTQQPVPAGNLTTNPSFETNTTGWAGSTAALARVAVAGTSNGTFAVKVSRSSGTSYGLDDNPNTLAKTLAAGNTYTAAAWVQSAATASNGKPVTIQIRERNAFGTIVKTTTGTGTLTGTGFAKITVTHTVAAANHSLDVFVRQTGAAAGHAFYADLVSLVKTG